MVFATACGPAVEDGDEGIDLAAASGWYQVQVDDEWGETFQLTFSSPGDEIVVSLAGETRAPFEGSDFVLEVEHPRGTIQFGVGAVQSTEYLETEVFDAVFVADDRFEGTYRSVGECDGHQCTPADTWTGPALELVGVQVDVLGAARVGAR